MSSRRRPSAARQTEKQFQAAVRKLAALQGWDVKCTWNSLHSPAGEPDLRMVRGQRIIYAELKTETGRLSPAQAETLAGLRRCAAGINTAIHGSVEPHPVVGFGVYVWRPGDWAEIEDVLK